MRYGAHRGFRSLKRASGDQIAKVAVVTWVCHGCGRQTPGKDKPGQCECGRMDFARVDSKAEARRWAELLILERAGDIRNLRRQVSYDLPTINLITGLETVVARYIADFVYEEQTGGEWLVVIEDVKGAITDVAHLKLRWMESRGVPVRVTT